MALSLSKGELSDADSPVADYGAREDDGFLISCPFLVEMYSSESKGEERCQR
jgi:hypothetical protein